MIVVFAGPPIVTAKPAPLMPPVRVNVPDSEVISELEPIVIAPVSLLFPARFRNAPEAVMPVPLMSSGSAIVSAPFVVEPSSSRAAPATDQRAVSGGAEGGIVLGAQDADGDDRRAGVGVRAEEHRGARAVLGDRVAAGGAEVAADCRSDHPANLHLRRATEQQRRRRMVVPLMLPVRVRKPPDELMRAVAAVAPAPGWQS